MICDKCGAKYHLAPEGKKKNGWTARANAQQWQGADAGSLTQTYPAPVARPRYSWTKSRTWERLVQSVVAGMALLACGVTFSKNPYFGTVACVSSVFFIGSVLFGADNWNVFFRLVDRNKDGRVDLDDVRQIFEDMFLEDSDEPETNVVVHEPPPIVYNDKGGTRTIPGVAPPIIHKVVVRKAALRRKALEVEVGALCEFIRRAVKTGRWGKRDWAGQTVGGGVYQPGGLG